jgi:haloalkane dehalogenase
VDTSDATRPAWLPEERFPFDRDRPALLVWPTKDVAFREPERGRWERLFPDHRTTMLEGAGHYIQEDAPDQIVAAIRYWAPATR